ncbi:hypothetical protein C8Q69DRAFT_470036 [Paecilomyces variotii]|uniref:RING-type domain-containing protein n=1 Tax=Byssochlamys spectabilis TaxID=264951 RepID=A0A443HRF1_BYSSP|nr:hypothetical protein C8Q69DRAFT_470036 [Paecilomyces variotii]RWQ94385.1 hypothetical protein C8Q69DRAFT_470036 [Paecilomyces variotii]
MSTTTYLRVPSRTDKGPLRQRDIELARMPCYVGYDYPDDAGEFPGCCQLCCEDTDSSTVFRRLPCNHIFHRPCIDRWLCTRDGSCPICRRKFYDLRRAYLVEETVPLPAGAQEKDQLRASRDAVLLWMKKILNL